MRAGIGCVLVIVLAASAGADDKIEAAKLVGKWEALQGKKDARMVLEFGKDGKLSATAPVEGKDTRIEGTYALDGAQLTLTLKAGGNEIKETQTITRLTADELEWDGKSGVKDKFRRVKDKQ